MTDRRLSPFIDDPPAGTQQGLKFTFHHAAASLHEGAGSFIPGRGSPVHPAAGAIAPPAVHPTARTRRWECRRADTNSRQFGARAGRSEAHTSELPSPMPHSYARFSLKK